MLYPARRTSFPKLPGKQLANLRTHKLAGLAPRAVLVGVLEISMFHRAHWKWTSQSYGTSAAPLRCPIPPQSSDNQCWVLKMQLMDILVTQHESVQLRTESGSPNIPMKLFLWRLQSALQRFKVLTSRIIQWWYQFWHDTLPMWPGTGPLRGTLTTHI